MQRPYGAWLDRHLELIQPGSLSLDLGCGEGQDTETLVIAGSRVVGLDLRRDVVMRAARRVPEADFVVGDLRLGLPFQSETVGLVVASLSLHYFDRRTTRAVVCDVSRVLKAQGMLLTRVNVVGDRASLYGVGIEHEPDYFEVEPGMFKRFFTEQSLMESLAESFLVDELYREETLVGGHQRKQTLVARARRRG